MHEQIKIAVGIKCANCQTCGYLGSESDGGEAGYSNSWATCDKKGHERYQYLKPFPFKKEQKCWTPNFWASKFSDMIDGTDDSVANAQILFLQSISQVQS